MLFIALLNSVKSHFARTHLRRSFRKLNDHTLKDIGFYREHGNIYPIAGKVSDANNAKKSVPDKSVLHKDGG